MNHNGLITHMPMNYNKSQSHEIQTQRPTDSRLWPSLPIAVASSAEEGELHA